MDLPSALFLAATHGDCGSLGILSAVFSPQAFPLNSEKLVMAWQGGCSFELVQDNTEVVFDVGSYLAPTYVCGTKQSRGHRPWGTRLSLVWTKTGPSLNRWRLCCHLAAVLFFFWRCVQKVIISRPLVYLLCAHFSRQKLLLLFSPLMVNLPSDVPPTEHLMASHPLRRSRVWSFAVVHTKAMLCSTQLAHDLCNARALWVVCVPQFKSMMSFIQARVYLRTEAWHIVFQQTRLPLAQIQLCPCAKSGELAVLLCV